MTLSTSQLGELVQIIAGQHIEASLHNDDPNGTPYLTGPADFGSTFPIISKWTAAPKVFATSFDVLVTVKGAGVGKSNLGCDAAIGRQLMALRPLEHKIDQSYLFHFLRYKEKDIAFLADGATVPGIGKDDLATLRIPSCSLNEQRRIAAILDKADALRHKRQRAMGLLDGLKQAIFSDMFGEPSLNPKGLRTGLIGDLLESTQYGTSAKAGSTGTYPILRMSNISTKGRISIDELKYVDLSDVEISRYMVRKGDILFNRTNSPDLVGKTAVFDLDDIYAFAGYLVRARTRRDISPRYISGYLNSMHGKKTLRGMAKSIVGMANINAREMQNIPILIPSRAEQMHYQKRVEAIDHGIGEQEKSLGGVDALVASLQHRAFTGQL